MQPSAHRLGATSFLVAAACCASQASAQLGALYPRVALQSSFASNPVAADFDADGAVDIASAGSAVTIRRGLGGLRYAPPVTVATGVGAHCLLAVDLDGDGRLDLLMANSSLDTITVLFGDGAGGFPVRSDLVVGDAPGWLAVGDMNEDGRLDVLATNFDADSVSLLLATGPRVFAGTVNFGVYKGPSCIDLSDFNEDGHLDFATANYTYPSTVTVRLGDGHGGFGPKNTFPAGGSSAWSTNSLIATDIDGDAHVDLLVTYFGVLFLHRGLGDGTFFPPVLALASNTNVVVQGDVNGDGRKDALVFASYGSGLEALLAYGGGSMPPVLPFSAAASSVLSLADLDGDGDLDALTTSPSTSLTTLHLGDGDGAFDELPAWITGGSIAVDDTLADLDGDGDDDVLVIQRSQYTNKSHSLGVLLQAGAAFGAPVLYPFEPDVAPLQWDPVDVVAGDLTGDGRPDVAVALRRLVAPFAAVVRVFVNDGTGGLLAQPDVVLPEALASTLLHLDIGALDADSLADVLVGYQTSGSLGRASVLRSTGGGSLQLLPSFALAGKPSALRLADLTLDGRLDLVVGGFVDFGPYVLQTLRGDGAGNFLPVAVVQPGFGVYGLAIGDVDEDGRPDVVIGESNTNSAWLTTYSGDGAGGLTKTFSETPVDGSSPGAGQPSALVDLDGDGHLDLIASDHGLATVLRGTGTGAFEEALRHEVSPAFSPLPTDLDGDGQVDLVVCHGGSLTALMHLPPPPWLDVGHALAAGASPPPSLVALSTLQSGAPIALSLAGGKPNGSAALVIGASELGAPFKGGTMVPYPSLILLGLPLDVHGHFQGAGTWYTGLPPGTSFWFQAWIPDPAGPNGFTASEALRGTTP